MIETRDLVKSVDTSEGVLTILRGVSLKFESGEAVAIVGASYSMGMSFRPWMRKSELFFEVSW